VPGCSTVHGVRVTDTMKVSFSILREIASS
jgi:hypothetical protein